MFKRWRGIAIAIVVLLFIVALVIPSNLDAIADNQNRIYLLQNGWSAFYTVKGMQLNGNNKPNGKSRGVTNFMGHFKYEYELRQKGPDGIPIYAYISRVGLNIKESYIYCFDASLSDKTLYWPIEKPYDEIIAEIQTMRRQNTVPLAH